MNKISDKSKVVVLFIGTILLCLIIYKLAISETIDVWRKSVNYRTQLKLIETAPEEIARVQSKMNDFNATMGKTMDTTYRNEPLLEFLSRVCRENKTVLADYISPHVSEQGDFRIETRTAIIEGKFINLLATLHEMEQNYAWGKTSSAGFNLKEDFRTNQRRLFLTVYIQSVINQTVPAKPDNI